MGLRVRVVLVLLSLLAIAALAVPLGLSLADRRTATLAAERGRQLAALADSAAMPGVPLQRLVDRYYEVYGEGVLVVDADGRPRAVRGLDDTDPAVATAMNRALVDAPAARWTRILPWTRHDILATAGVRHDGELIGAVVAAVDTSVAARGMAAGWLWVAIGCLSLLLLAVLVARALTRWVLRPVDGLERAVAEMTEGVPGLPADVAGPPELRHFTAAFNTMAEAVRASLTRQRRLVADASHQLRNPLAAVRLRADTLEDQVGEAGRSTYESMTAELDRLENLLHQLLRLARAEEVSGSRKMGLSDAVTESTDLDDVIEQRLAFWQPVAEERRQQLRCRASIPGSWFRSPAMTSSSCSTSPWTTRCATPARTPRSRCRSRPRTPRSSSPSATTAPDSPTRTLPGPPPGSGEGVTTRTGRVSDWPSQARSRPVTAGRSRWSAPPKVGSWFAIRFRHRVRPHAERRTARAEPARLPLRDGRAGRGLHGRRTGRTRATGLRRARAASTSRSPSSSQSRSTPATPT